MESKAVFHAQIWRTGFTAERATRQEPQQSPKENKSIIHPKYPDSLVLCISGTEAVTHAEYTKLPGGSDVENVLAAGQRGECLISVIHQAVPAPLCAWEASLSESALAGIFFFW